MNFQYDIMIWELINTFYIYEYKKFNRKREKIIAEEELERKKKALTNYDGNICPT